MTTEMTELWSQWKECHRCKLHIERTQMVFGAGNPETDVMFIGDGPGYHEDLQGEPFVGPAGELLTRIIESIGLQRTDVYITNIVKCRPPSNRNPEEDEVEACIPLLEKQIAIIHPYIICALGTCAAQTLLCTETPISTLRGRFYDYHGIRLMPTYHPAYLLRNPADKRLVWHDCSLIQIAMQEKEESSQELQELWDNVLELVKQKRRSLAATLRHATPMQLTQDTLILGFHEDASFSRNLLEDSKKKKIIAEALKDYLGRVVQVVVTIYKETPDISQMQKDLPPSISHTVLPNEDSQRKDYKPSEISHETPKTDLTLDTSQDRIEINIKGNEFREKFKAGYRTADGHYVRSRGEAMIDNWLYHSGIVHAYEKRPPIKEIMYSDFYLPKGDVYIEYWGKKDDSKYLARKKKKQAIYKRYHLNLIELEDADVSNLDDILPQKLLRFRIQII